MACDWNTTEHPHRRPTNQPFKTAQQQLETHWALSGTRREQDFSEPTNRYSKFESLKRESLSKPSSRTRSFQRDTRVNERFTPSRTLQHYGSLSLLRSNSCCCCSPSPIDGCVTDNDIQQTPYIYICIVYIIYIYTISNWCGRHEDAEDAALGKTEVRECIRV
jgi:hypothetical protein